VSSLSLESFARRSAVHRAGWFGKPATYGTVNVIVVITAVTSKKQLADAGFAFEHDAIARVMKGDVTYTLGSKFTYQSVQYRIEEVRNHPINPEWVLGLKQL